MRTVPEMMREAATIHEERAPLYGDNYKHAGEVLAGLFPHGIHIGPDDIAQWNRLHLVIHMASKLSRYCHHMVMHHSGHADSLDDLSVYAIMTKECDEMFAERVVTPIKSARTP